MKKINLSLVAIAMAASGLFAQEGAYMEMAISSETGATGSIKAYFSQSGQRSEFDMNVPKMPNGGIHYVSIFRKDDPDTMIRLDNANKTYTKTNISSRIRDNETYTVKKIGEENVNGYKCMHSLVTSNRGETSDMWVSKQVPFYEVYHKMSQGTRMGSPSKDKMMKEVEEDGFPVKTITKSKDGEYTIKLVKMEKRDCPSPLFEIPEGYTKSVPRPFNPADMQKMTPQERTKYMEEMKRSHSGN
jgi:hypothetical protein